MPPLLDALTTSRVPWPCLCAILTLTLWLGLSLSAEATTYYVSAQGDDKADGTAPERAWRSLDRVSAAELRPGDKVLLRRGDSWRGSIRARSGDETGPVTYGAYGEGDKPLLLGSVARNRPEDWRQSGGNLWVAGQPAAAATVRVPPAGSGQPLNFGLHTESGAVATLERGAEGQMTIRCTTPGKAGNHIQLITAGLKLQTAKAYKLTLRASCSVPLALPLARLMKAEPPWTPYSSGPPARRAKLTAEPLACVQYYLSSATADDGRLTFYLGDIIPAGGVLQLESVTFTECPVAEVPVAAPDALSVDVGNIIFDGGKSCGVKKWTKADLQAQDQYWYDQDDQLLYVYSAANPATVHQSIECALARHLINEGGVSYAIYENLRLMYGAAHGIGGGGTHHIIVRDCDFGFIGGADQYGGNRRVRFGNGIEFWGAAHDNLVERCRLWEIYDAALTNQNAGAVVKEYNLIYRNNVIWNSEYSFEFWNSPEASETYNVRFVNNTCLNAGGGWAHAQRPDPSGRHLCFYNSKGQARDLIIANNIFFEATKNAFYAPAWSREAVLALRLDHNLWQQKDGAMVSVAGKNYTQAEFAAYQQEFSQEPHSLVGDPRFVDAAALDFRLAAGSPAANAGREIPEQEQGAAPGKACDLGALERRQQ